MPKPYIDLILLCYGKFETNTKPCLDSLLPDINNENFRLTVVDNCSPDNSAEALRTYLKDQPRVRAVYLEKNVGFSGGMNYGASLAEGEWLLLVSNDTILAQGTLLSLFHALKHQTADVGMVGPITNAAGNGQGYSLRGNANQVLSEAKFVQQTPCNTLVPSYRLDFYCVAIRKSLWEKLNGLDPIFGSGYYEDTDFSMRARAVGSKLLICEDAFVYHVGGATLSTAPGVRELIKRNKKIFLRRHPDAKLPHKREDNRSILEEYAKLRQSGQWNDGLNIRLKYRVDALLSDLPRSPLKKWLWQRKIKKILTKLADAGCSV